LKKIYILFLIGLLVIFAITGCNGVIPPNGTEGEGEGEGEPEPVKATVLVEAYIATGCSACQKVEPFLEQLVLQYGKDKMILVEIAPWGDYHTKETEQRYNWYGLSGGVPQITFNGLSGHLIGAASYQTIKSKIDSQLAATPTIKLEATKTTSSTGTIIQGKIKNVSNSSFTGLVINGMVFRNRGMTGFRYSVTDIFDDEKVSISTLSPGEEKDFILNIPGLNWTAKDDGVVFVQGTTGKKVIHQSLFLD
jgi:thiol-disulfide isomerase/thioredoxin